jgi:hypothetical protein
MKYKITRAIIGSQTSIDITEDEYTSIKRAKHNLVVFLDVEEKLDLLLENYAEYERSLIDLTLNQMLYMDLDWSSFRADVQLVNRRITNLLSAARLYVDQVKHDIGAIFGSESDVINKLKMDLSTQYDDSLGFRVMEALRNHIQHRSLPVYKMSYPAKVEEPGVPSSKIRFGIVPSLDTARLEEDEDFKATVLEELKSVGSYVPLTPLVREYVERLCCVHESLRRETVTDVSRWDAIVADVERRATDAFGKDLLSGLAVVTEDDAGLWPEIDRIFSDITKRRKSIVRKNRNLRGLSHRYISGATEGSPVRLSILADIRGMLTEGGVPNAAKRQAIY